jgi:hypothetical protein
MEVDCPDCRPTPLQQEIKKEWEDLKSQPKKKIILPKKSGQMTRRKVIK